MKTKLTILLILFAEITMAQNNIKWDDTAGKNRSEQFKTIEIKSSIDGELQKALVHFTSSETPQPLIVSLHTWSGDYTQHDPLTKQITENDWNYIHPDFRGPNKTPKACGSKYVISDIDDAISYAIENGNVDINNIHVIGVSGGGYATMLAYMKSGHNIKTFSAWAGISDIVAWYYESLGRKSKYAEDISLATQKNSSGIDIAEAKLRSPLFMDTPLKKRTNSKLFLYCGIHDGYTGSVPITHTINFYNKVVSDFNLENTQSKVPAEITETMLRQQNLPGTEIAGKLGDRKIIYRNSYKNEVFLNVFEGGHEMLADVALKHIPTKGILLIGDSNGAFSYGWANQLKNLRATDIIINTSVSGNTIGFDNGGYEKLNTLKNIDKYIDKAIEQTGTIDYIVILLGTNDCKAVFGKQLKEVPHNLEKLITTIRNSKKLNKTPQILVVSPPPFGPDKMLRDKYKGGAKRVNYLTAEFKKVAEKMEVEFVDIHTPLEPVFNILSHDGVHLSTEGQIIIAKIINKKLDILNTNK